MEPGFSWLAVRVHKDQNFDVGRKLRNGIAEIVDFFPAPDRLTCKEDCGFDARLRGDAFYCAGGRIVFGSENEKELIVLMIELAESNQVAFQTMLQTAAGANDRGTRSVKAGIDHEAAFRIGQPQHALIDEIKPDQDLQGGQNFKNSFHAA